MVINTRFSVGDHVIYRDGMEIYEVKIEKITIIATGKYLHSTKYEFDNGCTALKEFIPIGIKECLKTNTTLKGGITNLVHMVIY